MTLEEAEKIALDNNLTKDNLSKCYGDYYRFEVIHNIDSPKFIDKVKQFIKYLEKRESLVDEYYKWHIKNKLGPLRVEFDLNSYLAAGIIPLKNMEEGYYLGKCRNSMFAYWDPKHKIFKHTRNSWNLKYVEDIPHLEEVGYSFDLFIPLRKLNIKDVNENERIDKWIDGIHIEHKKIIDDINKN